MTAHRILVRATSPAVMHGRGSVWLLGPQKDGCTLTGESAALLLAVLAAADAPLTREELAQSVLAQAEGTGDTKVVLDAIALLVRFGALVERGAPEPRSDSPAREEPSPLAGAHVVVAVTGAVGSLATPGLVERLLASGCEVRVAMTRSARRFVTARAFEAITHRKVASSLWKGSPDVPAPHVELARWADALVVYPCTATTLARVAAGDCSELVSAVATTTRAPVLLAPSMNTDMLRAPAVDANLERLRDQGFFLAHPGFGLEVADAPGERIRRMGVAAPITYVQRYVALLLARAAADGPRLLTRAEWELEHVSHEVDDSIDPDIAAALDDHAKARVLDVGTGLGAVARAAAKRGHVVVATDFATKAIECAAAVAPELPVTWVVDDMTDSGLRGTFDLCIDRASFGCVPVSRRERYVERVAALVRPGGEWVLKVHRAPTASLRAHAFTRDEVLALVSNDFELALVTESSLHFGNAKGCPAWTLRLRRRGRR